MNGANDFHKAIFYGPFFHIHWLPIEYEKRSIREFLESEASFLNIMDLRKENLLTDNKFFNGVVRVKVEYIIEEHPRDFFLYYFKIKYLKKNFAYNESMII